MNNNKSNQAKITGIYKIYLLEMNAINFRLKKRAIHIQIEHFNKLDNQINLIFGRSVQFIKWKIEQIRINMEIII